MAYERKTETAYRRHGKGFTRVRVVSRYPEAKAARIIVGERGDEMIVRESELLPTKPETPAAARHREHYEKLLNRLTPLIAEPETLMEIARLDCYNCHIAIYQWLSKLKRMGKVKFEENKWRLA